jgi:acyl carrier protein
VLGRIDHQIKVRGFRIELQEVEAALARHLDLREAVALARDGRLVAFVVASAGREVTSAAVRSFLGGILPEYMIPSLVMALPAFPLTPNGKVDRRALPAPEPPRGDEGAFVPPSTEMEELVARVWAQVLGIERVGAHDRFFDIGGQSLLATQVVSRLRRELGCEIPLRTLFELPTLAGFSYALEDLLLEETV